MPPTIQINVDAEGAGDLMALLELAQSRNWSPVYFEKLLCVCIFKIKEAIELHHNAATN